MSQQNGEDAGTGHEDGEDALMTPRTAKKISKRRMKGELADLVFMQKKWDGRGPQRRFPKTPSSSLASSQPEEASADADGSEEKEEVLSTPRRRGKAATIKRTAKRATRTRNEIKDESNEEEQVDVISQDDPQSMDVDGDEAVTVDDHESQKEAVGEERDERAGKEANDEEAREESHEADEDLGAYESDLKREQSDETAPSTPAPTPQSKSKKRRIKREIDSINFMKNKWEHRDSVKMNRYGSVPTTPARTLKMESKGDVRPTPQRADKGKSSKRTKADKATHENEPDVKSEPDEEAKVAKTEEGRADQEVDREELTHDDVHHEEESQSEAMKMEDAKPEPTPQSTTKRRVAKRRGVQVTAISQVKEERANEEPLAEVKPQMDEAEGVHRDQGNDQDDDSFLQDTTPSVPPTPSSARKTKKKGLKREAHRLNSEVKKLNEREANRQARWGAPINRGSTDDPASGDDDDNDEEQERASKKRRREESDEPEEGKRSVRRVKRKRSLEKSVVEEGKQYIKRSENNSPRTPKSKKGKASDGESTKDLTPSPRSRRKPKSFDPSPSTPRDVSPRVKAKKDSKRKAKNAKRKNTLAEEPSDEESEQSEESEIDVVETKETKRSKKNKKTTKRKTNKKEETKPSRTKKANKRTREEETEEREEEESEEESETREQPAKRRKKDKSEKRSSREEKRKREEKSSDVDENEEAQDAIHADTDEEAESGDEAGGYQLARMVRCHSAVDDDRHDDNISVYGVRFHPEEANILATAGGDSVCVYDCKAMRLLKKYKQPPQAGKEEFYALAWTTLALRSKQEDTKCFIIAAGGKQGDIKLIDYESSQLFAVLQVPTLPGMPLGSQKAVEHIAFSPKHPWLMLTAHLNGSILVWSIAAPKPGAQHTCLAHLKGHAGSVYDFSVSPSGEEVISGSEDDTLRLWKLPESVVAKANLTNEIVEINAERVWPNQLDGVMDMAQFVDDTTVAIKDASSGFILLLDISADPPQGLAKVRWLLRDLTSGEETGENFVFFLKGHISRATHERDQWLVVGKNDGRVNVYNVSSILRKATNDHMKMKTKMMMMKKKTRKEEEEEDHEDEERQYSRSFGLYARRSRRAGHPMWGATRSPDGNYIACGSSNNLIFIWRRKD